MNLLEDSDVDAKEAAGNWRKFSCFAWFEKPADAENWTVVYTSNRDSGLIDQSNAAAIDKALRRFKADVRPEHHSHWACGYVDGYAIRVYRNGRITKAFRAYMELKDRMANYPLLDETDYCNREHEATLANIVDSAWRLKRDFDLPKDWQSAVYSWLSDNDDSAVENCDDQGGYPSEEQLRAAFAGLGYREAVAA
jgi:hypothetical protein